MIRTRWAAALVLTALLAACAGSPPAKAPAADTFSPEFVRSQLAAIAADRGAVQKLIVARYPQLTGRKRELMVDQAVAMFASPAFADRVHELVAPRLAARAAFSPGAQAAFQAELRNQAAALGMQLTLKGMTRLGPEDQARFVRQAIGLHRSVDAATCRALVDGKVSPVRMQEIEVTHNASLSDAEFEQGLAMSQRAMQAELAGAPSVPQLSDAQQRAAQAAWGRAIQARGKKPSDKARFDRVRADLAAASDADVCWITLQYLEAILDLRGNERVWQLQSYMLDTASDQ